MGADWVLITKEAAHLDERSLRARETLDMSVAPLSMDITNE